MAVEYHFSGNNDNQIFLADTGGTTYQLSITSDGTLQVSGNGGALENLNYVQTSGDTMTGNLLLDNGIDIVPVTGGSGNSDLGSVDEYFGTIYANNVVGAGFGEDNTASNLGGDEGLFSAKNGVDLEFRGLTAGEGIELLSGTSAVTVTASGVATNAADITFVSGLADTNIADIAINVSDIFDVSGIAASAIQGAANLLPGEGAFSTVNGTNLEFKGISGLGGIVVTSDTNTILVSGASVGEVNTASNLLPGEGTFAQKNGVDLEFKGVTGVGTITVTSDTNSVIISGSNHPVQEDYAFSFASGTQTVSVPSTFQTITMDTDAELNGWSRGGGTFTCPDTAKYLVNYSASYQKTSGGNARHEFRATFNGTEVFGSEIGALSVSNNEERALAHSFILDGTTGQDLIFEMTANSNRAEIVPVGLNATTRTSFTINITKL